MVIIWGWRLHFNAAVKRLIELHGVRQALITSPFKVRAKKVVGLRQPLKIHFKVVGMVKLIKSNLHDFWCRYLVLGLIHIHKVYADHE